jgi:hypothetical protein
MYLRDVNRIAGKDVRQTWGKPNLTIEDVIDPVKARWAARVYLSHYGNVYRKRTGMVPNEEVYARIHNGGPDGWKKGSTLGYWMNVEGYIEHFSRSMNVDIVIRKKARNT